MLGKGSRRGLRRAGWRMGSVFAVLDVTVLSDIAT